MSTFGTNPVSSQAGTKTHGSKHVPMGSRYDIYIISIEFEKTLAWIELSKSSSITKKEPTCLAKSVPWFFFKNIPIFYTPKKPGFGCVLPKPENTTGVTLFAPQKRPEPRSTRGQVQHAASSPWIGVRGVRWLEGQKACWIWLVKGKQELLLRVSLFVFFCHWCEFYMLISRLVHTYFVFGM